MSLRCGSFGSGHDVHYIQVIRVAPRHPAITIEDMDAPGDDVVRLLIEGKHHRLHDHAPQAVIEAGEARTGDATWTPDASLLQIPHSSGSACFSVSRTSLRPCAEDRAAQARTNGLFKAIIDEAIADGALEEGGGERR